MSMIFFWAILYVFGMLTELWVLVYFWQFIVRHIPVLKYFVFIHSTTNRLEESKNIFDTIVNNTTFQGISIILFLNKTDLLEQKILNSRGAVHDITTYYPQFSGDPKSIVDVHQFILTMFLNVRRNRDTAIYYHFTTAVDTNNIQHVFRDVKANILNNNLMALNLH